MWSLENRAVLSSSFKGSPAGTPKGCNPFAAASMMRNMTASAPHPLNSINQMRLPNMGSPITSMANNLAQTPTGGPTPKRIKSESRFAKVRLEVMVFHPRAFSSHLISLSRYKALYFLAQMFCLFGVWSWRRVTKTLMWWLLWFKLLLGFRCLVVY